MGVILADGGEQRAPFARHGIAQLPSAAVAEESHDERVNRELIELLNELRVALPGVQVLFAFLLAVPFTERFEQVDRPAAGRLHDRAAAARSRGSVFLIAPTAFHRIRFRDRDKESLLVISNRLRDHRHGAARGRDDVVRLPRHRPALQGRRRPPSSPALVAGLFGLVWFALPLFRKATD